MAQKKPPRVLFNPEHVEVARDLLSDKDAGRLFFAICDYAMEGKLPENESKSWMACFKLMRSDIDRDKEKYVAKCEKNRQNVKARWNKDATEYIPAHDDTNVYGRIQSNSTEYETYATQHNATQNNATATAKKKESSPADDDISAQIVAHQRADDLIRRYKLPDTDMSREALLEDAERVGFDRLEEVLKQASLSNNRQGLSVNFYRAILNSSGAQKGEKMIAIENL